MFREGNYSWQIKKKGGQQGGSLDKGTCHQDYLPKFNLWVPHGGRETTPTGCPWLLYLHTHIHTQKYCDKKQTKTWNKKNNKEMKKEKDHLNIFCLGLQ